MRRDLLKAIYTLDVTGGCVSIRDVAQAVSSRSVGEGRAQRPAYVWVAQVRFCRIAFQFDGGGPVHANDLIRAHRLWEAYLVDRQGLALEAVHVEADVREHTMTPEELERADREPDYPARDPHGHMILARERTVEVIAATRSLLEEATPGRCCVSPPMIRQKRCWHNWLPWALSRRHRSQVLEREVAMLRVRVDANVMPLAVAAARQGCCACARPALPLRNPVGSRARAVEISGSGSHQ